jgi:hypothetical protein
MRYRFTGVVSILVDFKHEHGGLSIDMEKFVTLVSFIVPTEPSAVGLTQK